MQISVNMKHFLEKFMVSGLYWTQTIECILLTKGRKRKKCFEIMNCKLAFRTKNKITYSLYRNLQNNVLLINIVTTT